MKESIIVNSLRAISLDAITNSKSGHPGVCLSAGPIFYSVFKNMKIDTNNLKYYNRDFFVASAGHASSLLYSTMHLFNMGISLEDLKNFRKINSVTPGHPEISTNGVDCATGPLGQGVANSVGLALASKHMQAVFNKKDITLFNNYIYCFFGDGCLMEGVSLEAFSLASKLKLDNLIFIYDRNNKTIEGSLDITFSEDVFKKFEALNFNIISVKNGNSVEDIDNAINKAKGHKGSPSVIIVDTLLGFGSHVEDSELSHGKPFTKEQVLTYKQKHGLSGKEFEIDKKVYEFVNKLNTKKQKDILKEKKSLELYKKRYPNDYEKLEKYYNFEFNNEILNEIKKLNTENNLSTRENNHYVLNEIFEKVLNVIGGSADVNTSSMVYLKNEKYINEDFAERNVHFGVREHAMGAISNGICLFGGMLAFCSCYLSFADYLKPALRMTCLMDLPVLYEFSHDNVLIGEDGPTHQPVEQLVTLRATPNLNVFRPYNLTEILASYYFYLKNKKPTAIILSKEKVNNQVGNIKNALKGGYTIFKEKGELKAVILSSGMEVDTAIEVAKEMEGIRVVSLPCFEVFDKQSEKYKYEVLTDKPKIALELSSSYSYHKYVGEGLYLTMDTFGKSGKVTELKDEFGFTKEAIKNKIKNFLKYE